MVQQLSEYGCDDGDISFLGSSVQHRQMCLCVGDQEARRRQSRKTDLAASYGNGDKEGAADGQEGINDQRGSSRRSKAFEERGNLEGEHSEIF